MSVFFREYNYNVHNYIENVWKFPNFNFEMSQVY